MIDHRLRQQQIVEREYLLPFAEEISQEAWVSGVKQRKWPAKARYMWALSAIYVPSEAIRKEDAA